MKTVVLGPILRLLFRPWVEGAEHVPETGAAIFASNHLSFSDSIFLPLVVPRRMTFLAKSDYFTGEGLKGRLTAAFFKAWASCPSTAPVAGRARPRCGPGSGCCGGASCSGSTRRARAAPTAGSTGARPGSRGWRSRRACPSSPSR